MLWPGESKFNLRGSDGRLSVRRPRGEKFNPRYTTQKVNIMVWGYFSGYGIGPIHRITDTLTSTVYRNLLSTVMLPYVECDMLISWTFKHDNDSKHTARLVKTWIEDSNTKVMEWPYQSPDLNPIENMWMTVKRSIGSKVFQN